MFVAVVIGNVNHAHMTNEAQLQARCMTTVPDFDFTWFVQVGATGFEPVIGLTQALEARAIGRYAKLPKEKATEGP